MVSCKSAGLKSRFITVSSECPHSTTESVCGPPSRRLASHVLEYRGYLNSSTATATATATLRALPSLRTMLVISGDAPLQVVGAGAARVSPVMSALFGPRTRTVVAERPGGRTLLVHLSPPGAYVLLGTSMHELTDTVADLGDLLGRSAQQIVDIVTEPVGWQKRFTLLDEVLIARADAGPVPAPQIIEAWQCLSRSAGRIPIAQLAAEVGWTRRHLLTRFREQIGLSPKTAARVFRFQHALRLLRRPGHPSLAQIASVTGFSDQAHLTREFRVLADTKPTELAVPCPHCAGTTFGTADFCCVGNDDRSSCHQVSQRARE